MTNDTAMRAEQARDLRNQISELNGVGAEHEIIIRDTSPLRRKSILYSTVNGQAVRLPSYMAETAISKKLPDGTFMFTADPSKAPNFKLGEVRCFLSIDSPERLSGTLELAGLSGYDPCPAQNLGSPYSKRMHAQHRHKMEWAMLQEWETEQKETNQNDRQDRQIAAMQDLAKKAATK